jgi:hypothetical protein
MTTTRAKKARNHAKLQKIFMCFEKDIENNPKSLIPYTQEYIDTEEGILGVPENLEERLPELKAKFLKKMGWTVNQDGTINKSQQ